MAHSACRVALGSHLPPPSTMLPWQGSGRVIRAAVDHGHGSHGVPMLCSGVLTWETQLVAAGRAKMVHPRGAQPQAGDAEGS